LDDLDGTRFDVFPSELCRITGVRNIRQALASPYPVFHSRFGAAHFQFTHEKRAMPRLGRLVLMVSLAALTPACAASLHNPHVADLQHNPGRYQDHTVSITGVVTSSWGVPLAPYKMYRVSDGTGEVTVLSQGVRLPTRGARVRVRGRVDDLAVFGGQAVGLHLREEALYVKR
jgi:hypothetical protein